MDSQEHDISELRKLSYFRERSYNPPLPLKVRENTIKTLSKIVYTNRADTEFFTKDHSYNEIIDIEKNLKPHLKNYCERIKQFKKEGETFSSAQKLIDDLYEDGLDELFDKGEKSLVSLTEDLKREALIYSICGNKSLLDVWHDFYFTPERQNELPNPIFKLSQFGAKMFGWDALKTEVESFKKHDNPYTPLFELFQTGIWDLHFVKDNNGVEKIEVMIKQNQMEGGDFKRVLYDPSRL